MVAFPAHDVSTRMIILNSTGVRTIDECMRNCIDQPLCRMSQYNAGACTIYTLSFTPIASDEVPVAGAGNAVTFVKRGGCQMVDEGANCQYVDIGEVPDGVHDRSSCSANGASYAFSANARLYYGASNIETAIETELDTGCSAAEPFFHAHPLMTETGFHVELKAVDLQLLWNRMETLHRSPASAVEEELSRLLNRLYIVGNGGAPPTIPGTTKAVLTVKNATAMTITANTATDRFALTQSFAMAPAHDEGPSSCVIQADLATNMVGDLDTGLQKTCYLAGNCMPSVFDNIKMLQEMRLAYALQSIMCRNALGWQFDTTSPVPLVMYVQPPVRPRSPWLPYLYQGLPTYSPTSPYDQKRAKDDSMQLFGPTSPSTPFIEEPLPTPATIDPFKPTPAPYPYDIPLGPMQADDEPDGTPGCYYTLYSRSVVKGTGKLMTFDMGVYTVNSNATIEKCAQMCDTVLLCRFITYPSCQMYGFTVQASNLEDSYVDDADDGCRVTKYFFVHGPSTPIAGTTARMAIKDDCCIRDFPT